MSRQDDAVDVECTVIHQTDAGVLLESHDTGRQSWFPLSLVEDNDDGSWAVPERMAQDREFI